VSLTGGTFSVPSPFFAAFRGSFLFLAALPPPEKNAAKGGKKTPQNCGVLYSFAF
jgi:hypothetical protein